MRRFQTKWPVLLTAAMLCSASAAWALPPGKVDPDGLDWEQIRASAPQAFSRGGTVTPEELPDVFGPGAVLTVGNVFMKITNWGWVGNLLTNLSSDPSGQWKGASGIEYLSGIRLAVGAVNPSASDPNARRRVSYLQEWRPQTLEPADKIYRAYDGIVNGTRNFNDDGDDFVDPGSGLPVQLIDEDFLDGRDNDGDGRIDEDFAALGQQMFSLVMWDNTIEAVNTTFNEKHVPLGLECRQRNWAYSIAGFQDFNVVEYEIFNRSGHDLDSVTVAFLVDMDAGPFESSNYFQDDFDLPQYPSGLFPMTVGPLAGQLPDAVRAQADHDPVLDGQGWEGIPLCPVVPIRINGFSVADDNGDENKTFGVGSFLLIDHSVDPLGLRGPKHVGFRSFRSFTAGTPYTQGGNPTIDQQRFEFMTSTENVDVETGFISRAMPRGDTKGDYIQWVTVGSPWAGPGGADPPRSNGLWRLSDGQSITVTIAFSVSEGTYALGSRYLDDLGRFEAGLISREDLINQHPVLNTAFSAQVAFEGIHEVNEGFPATTFHGRETALRRPVGAPDTLITEDCPGRDLRVVNINSREYSWFDFDCNYCTGVYDYNGGNGRGMFRKTWNAAAPPPNPNVNVSSLYNFTDNPDRKVVPTGDHVINLAWDNLSEVTADPKSECFDFRGYKIWKVSDWTRPVGAAGPAESDWKLLAELRMFDYEDENDVPIERNYEIVDGEKVCPLVFIPNAFNTVTGTYGDSLPICLDRGDLWDRQSGRVLKPDTSFHCVPSETDPSVCKTERGGIVLRGVDDCKRPENKVDRPVYPVGRYQYLDPDVKNGFVYFYSVTAFDSTFENSVTNELGGRRSAVESEGVTPQAAAKEGQGVWVVPNPYRGYSDIARRSSSWDLTPNAADPTGTHIDFMGLPPGMWTIRIFTVSGDLVAELLSTDAVNESIRSPQTVSAAGGSTIVPGYNRQQDYSNDGQARWNLISRNGQDIVSGIYLFTVESAEGTQRGKFVVIR